MERQANGFQNYHYFIIIATELVHQTVKRINFKSIKENYIFLLNVFGRKVINMSTAIIYPLSLQKKDDSRQKEMNFTTSNIFQLDCRHPAHKNFISTRKIKELYLLNRICNINIKCGKSSVTLRIYFQSDSAARKFTTSIRCFYSSPRQHPQRNFELTKCLDFISRPELILSYFH